MDILAGARHAWIEVRARPRVSAVAVVTLALGVGGATAMFTTLSAVGHIMVPPGVDPARVARVVWVRADESARSPVTAEEYAHLARNLGACDTVSAWADDERRILGGIGGPTVSARRVSPSYFQALGFTTSAGRLFTAQDALAESPRVAIVRDGARARLDADIGRDIRLGGESYTVVGILPDTSWYPSAGGPDVWLPLETSRDGVPAARSVWVTVRLRRGDATALDLARGQVASAGARLAEAAAEPALRSRRLLLVTLQSDTEKRLGFGIVGFLGPGVVVLLITCGNVANLLLARAARREHEMAVRAALGASRLRLICERLAESAWLGGLGGLLGVGLAFAGVRLLRAWIGAFEQARGAADAMRVDFYALLFALAVTATIPIAFGLVPALTASRPNLTAALHAVPGPRRPRRGPYGGRDVLVIVEVGLAVVLVLCAVMFSRFFGELGNVRWGFDPAKVLAIPLSLEDKDSPDALAADSLRVTSIVDAVRQVPGVRAAAAGSATGMWAERDGQPIEFEGCADATGRAGAVATGVGPRYFATLGLVLRRGRPILETDTGGSAPVVVISEKHAARCWPGEDPIGKRVRQGRRGDARWLTVVGVVSNTMVTRVLADAPQPVYVPYLQTTAVPRAIIVSADRHSQELVDRIRAAIRRVDPTQPLDEVTRADEGVRRGLGGATLIVGVVGVFGLFALALGVLGVFSVTSYMVAERTREFGIRLALGASRRQVLALVLRQAFVVVGIGTAVSFAGTMVVTRVAFREMADLAVVDPVLWASVCLLLVGVAVGAAILPARRATRVQPVVALHAE